LLKEKVATFLKHSVVVQFGLILYNQQFLLGLAYFGVIPKPAGMPQPSAWQLLPLRAQIMVIPLHAYMLENEL